MSFSIAETEEIISRMSPSERSAFVKMVQRAGIWTPLPGPQTMAYSSKADIIGFGGAAGGGKTDLICGFSLTGHRRIAVFRKEKAQTEGIVQRLSEIVGSTAGLNSQKGIWKISSIKNSPLIEFGGLDNPGDHQRWQGRPHDLKALDEVTEMREYQARFVMGWNRTSDPNIRSRVLMTFNPPTTAEGRWVVKFFAPWLDPKHPNPAKPGELRYFSTVGDNQDYELPSNQPFVVIDGHPAYDFDQDQYSLEQIVTPKSRTFFPAKITDNIYYMQSNYMATLQALPEPLRSQMLYGDFMAGIEDDPWQVIPTAWVESSMARWTKPIKLPPMDSLGVDVARGGRDNTILYRRHGMWFDEALTYPGSATPDGPTVAGLSIAALRDQAPIHIDVIGVGASPYDFLKDTNQQVVGVNVSEKPTALDKSGRLQFRNLRSQLWWQLREALDPNANNGICLPPDPKLLADLCAPTWQLTGSLITVASRDEIIAKIGRSPDYGSALCLALIDTPKRAFLPFGSSNARRNILDYDPYASN
jgi:hypothetical protein